MWLLQKFPFTLFWLETFTLLIGNLLKHKFFFFLWKQKLNENPGGEQFTKLKTLLLLVKRRWLLQWREFSFTLFSMKAKVWRNIKFRKIYEIENTSIVGQKKVAFAVEGRGQHFSEVSFHTFLIKNLRKQTLVCSMKAKFTIIYKQLLLLVKRRLHSGDNISWKFSFTLVDWKLVQTLVFPILKQKHDETPGREQTPIEIRNQRTGVRNVKGCGLRHMTFLSSLLLCLSCLLRKHYSIHTLSRGNHTLHRIVTLYDSTHLKTHSREN